MTLFIEPTLVLVFVDLVAISAVIYSFQSK